MSWVICRGALGLVGGVLLCAREMLMAGSSSRLLVCLSAKRRDFSDCWASPTSRSWSKIEDQGSFAGVPIFIHA